MTLNQKSPSPLELIRADVRSMRGYTPGEQIRGAIKLNTNESAFPPSPRVRAVLAGIADDSLRLYPDPVSRKLRETAAALYGVAPDQVLAGNGSDDCLTILYRAFLSPGDEVRVPWPTYGLYDTLATLQGARLSMVPYRQVGRRWELPEELGAAGAKMVIVANPNNPSATLASTDELRRLCARSPGIVVVDEAYVDFSLGAGLAASMLPFLNDHDNLVVLRTFSKSYSLAGARLGLLFAAPALVAELTKVKDSYNVNVITQALGTAALEDREHHRELIAQHAGAASAARDRARGDGVHLARVGGELPAVHAAGKGARRGRFTWRSRRRGCWCGGGERRSCASDCASPSGNPRTTTGCSRR